MKLRLDILRREAGGEPYLQSFPYETEDDAETVATALTRLNETLSRPIRWECSCLQKKCGACAMVIDGRPVLACNARLADYKGAVRIEPLRKFPVVADLIVDRSVLYENLKTLRVWLSGAAVTRERTWELSYESSRCLQCACCLEVCPNFAPGGAFAGTAAAAPLARLLSGLSKEALAETAKSYRTHFYNGCGKSLACRKICPAGIDIDHVLAASNAVAVWKRLNRL